MEPRSAIGEWDAAEGRYILRVGCQGVFGLRNQMANDILKVPVDKVRILTGNVGGSFGMKASRLSGIRLRAACGEAARPPGEMDG